MRICILAAGAAGMICGSCLRDNALAVALRRLGHDATLVPLYTPLRTDGENAATGSVYFGGVNVYLQHALRLFRHTPRFVDWLFDRPSFLRAAGNLGAGTAPRHLAGMTRAMLRGEHGDMAKEVSRLVHMLETLRPDVISLPNLMFIGVADILQKTLRVPVVMECTGEDIFLDAMDPDDQREVRDLIRAGTSRVAAFVATSDYYAARMAAYLDIARDRVATVYPGVPHALLEVSQVTSTMPHPKLPAVGHLARIDPAKGLDIAQAAIDEANTREELTEFWYAGWNSPQHRAWHQKIRAGARRPGRYFGELDLERKAYFLDRLDVFLATAPYPEPKGLYAIEAMARGVPVIAANHGAFPEIVGDGGILVPPGDAHAFAGALKELVSDRPKRDAMAFAARRRALAHFTDQHMAFGMLGVYDRVLRPASAAVS